MKEVSCRIFATFLDDLKRRRLPASRLVAGTSYRAEHLADRHERVEWAAFSQMMANARQIWTPDEIVQLGEDSVRGAVVRFIGVIGRAFSSGAFYRWVASPERGAGNQMITCVRPSMRDAGPGRMILDLLMAPGYEPCPELFLLTRGTFAAMPRMIGQPAATVTQSDIPDGVRFDIRFEERSGLGRRLWRAASWPINAGQAAIELKDAHETLQSRYHELAATRDALERRTATLQTAYNLGQRLFRELDPERAEDVVVRGLVELAGFAGAELRAASAGLAAVATAGQRGPDGDAIRVGLAGHSGEAGVLMAWTPSGVERAERVALLDFLAPTVTLALENAASGRALAAYQRDLERRVDERTAELRAASDALADTVHRLEDAQAARERFFANISHEIRTPLSLILLAVADVEAHLGAHLDDHARGGLGAIVTSARRLLRLVDELLLLAAGREHKLTVAPVAIDLVSLVGAITATWRPAAESAGLGLILATPATCTALLDPVAIERVLSNLVSNAVKYTPRGGRIHIDVEVSGPDIDLVVRDTGVGIDEDLQRRLFGRFEQGRGAINARSGSGIGLSLVKELVDAHGGSVGATSARGGGTEMRVKLPGARRTAIAVEGGPLRLRPTDYGFGTVDLTSGQIFTPRGTSAATILVAEDNPHLASSVAHLLSDDHTVIVALDGLTALELAKQHQPDLLISDVDMPGLDGIALTKRFRELPGNMLAPVLILSAHADLGDRLGGLEAGAVDYIVKPFDPGELRARVRAQLAQRQLALRLHRAEQLATLGTLSAGLAHELRNPANAIVNAVGPLKELLPDEMRDPDGAVAQLIDVLSSCAEQIAFLSRQLLGWKRGGDLELREATLGELIGRALALAQPALRDVVIRDRLRYRGLLRCAPPMIVQIITNLVENAAHAAGAGGWIEISGDLVDGRITVEVADSGPGVPIGLRERIFEPFFTTKPPGQGTGLGLSTSRDIAHRHGGALEVRDRDGRSLFTLELPHHRLEAAR